MVSLGIAVVKIPDFAFVDQHAGHQAPDCVYALHALTQQGHLAANQLS
jgi:hypothetical protein